MSSLDFDDDDAELVKLRHLYETLQAHILTTLEELARLRESGDYELYRLNQERPDFLQVIADQQAEAIATEIAELEIEALELTEEIESLTGAEDPFGA